MPRKNRTCSNRYPNAFIQTRIEDREGYDFIRFVGLVDILVEIIPDVYKPRLDRQEE
jgi:hypothetical protein